PAPAHARSKLPGFHTRPKPGPRPRPPEQTAGTARDGSRPNAAADPNPHPRRHHRAPLLTLQTIVHGARPWDSPPVAARARSPPDSAHSSPTSQSIHPASPGFRRAATPATADLPFRD